jgi:hypothetical protein
MQPRESIELTAQELLVYNMVRRFLVMKNIIEQFAPYRDSKNSTVMVWLTAHLSGRSFKDIAKASSLARPKKKILAEKVKREVLRLKRLLLELDPSGRFLAFTAKSIPAYRAVLDILEANDGLTLDLIFEKPEALAGRRGATPKTLAQIRTTVRLLAEEQK